MPLPKNAFIPRTPALAKALREARQALDISLYEASMLCRVSPESICQLENKTGGTMRRDTLVLLAKGYNSPTLRQFLAPGKPEVE